MGDESILGSVETCEGDGRVSYDHSESDGFVADFGAPYIRLCVSHSTGESARDEGPDYEIGSDDFVYASGTPP